MSSLTRADKAEDAEIQRLIETAAVRFSTLQSKSCELGPRTSAVASCLGFHSFEASPRRHVSGLSAPALNPNAAKLQQTGGEFGAQRKWT